MTGALGSVTLAMALVALATGCNGNGKSLSSTTKSTPIRSALPAPVAGCARATVRGLESFVRAINAGHAKQADRWVSQNDFVWFVLGARVPGSTPPPLPINRTVQLRGELLAYLGKRVQAHDQLRLRSLHVNNELAGDATRPTLGFAAGMRRRAHDLAGGRWLTLAAKGEWLCGEDKMRGLVGHADLPGGPPERDMQCPSSSPAIEGVRICT